LLKAYRLAGYEPGRDYRFVEVNRAIRAMYPKMLDDLTLRLQVSGAHVSHDPETSVMLINGEYTASIVLSRCKQTPAGSLRWAIRMDQRLAPDITILVRMDAANEQPADYYLFPIMDIAAPRLLLCETNGVYLDTYQFDSLDYFASMAARHRIEVAA